MNINLKNCYRKIANLHEEIENCSETLECEIQGYDTRGSKDSIEDLRRLLDEVKRESDFINVQIIEFLEELRDRKDEGIVIVNELLDVCCMNTPKDK